MGQWLGFVAVLAAGTLATCVVGVLAWRRRFRTPAAPALAWVMAGLTEWGLVEVLGGCSTQLGVQRALSLAIYPGVGASVAGFFWLCQVSVDPDRTLSRRGYILLAVEPALITVLAATDPFHHLVVSRSWLVGDPPLLSWTAGPAFWVHTLYSYALLGWGVRVMVAGWRDASTGHRRQLITLTLAALPPLIANLVSVLGFAGAGAVDVSVFGMLVTGLVDGWAVLWRDLVQVLPVARAKVLEQLSDAMVVLDPDGRVLDRNAAAERLLPLITPAVAAELDHLLRRQVGGVPGRTTSVTQCRIADGGRDLDLDLRADLLLDRRGRTVGQVVVARDVTELRSRERELSSANTRLEELVRTIEGLRADLAEQAVHDPLTGLYNRRYLIDELSRQLPAAAASGLPLAVVLVDIDHFKQVNDRFGHQAGDRVLIAIAHALRECAGAGDTVARFGGEEFVVVLPGTAAETAGTRAEAWRRACSLLRVPTERGEVRATFSAGVAGWPGSGLTLEDLLEAADRALYRAKEAGRDRIELAGVWA